MPWKAEVQTVGDGTIWSSNDLVFDNSDVEEERWEDFSNTVSLKWSVAEASMVYATVSAGFKTGGWPLAAVFPDDFTAFDTETTTNFEVGSKGSFSEGQLQFQVAAFHTDWRDQQLSANIDRRPDLAHYCPGVDVEVFGFQAASVLDV